MSEILEKIKEFSCEFEMFPGPGLVLVCVSGGADSMCLLEALREISREFGFSIAVAHFNHNLRGDESVRDEMFVREYCRMRDVPFYSGSGDVGAFAKNYGSGLEEAARDLRYGFFISTAEKTGAVRIATAHTADDNAETMILNLVRGAGANGLSGIPPKRGIYTRAGDRNESGLYSRCMQGPAESVMQGIMIIRPMLRVSRQDVLQFTGERGVPFIEDSTNSLDVFTRNKIRHKVMPVIREINPRYHEAVSAAAELSRADEEYLSEVADTFIGERCTRESMNNKNTESGIQDPEFAADGVCDVFSADAKDILSLPFAVSGRVIRKLCGRSLSYKHVKAVLELCGRENPSASLTLPGMIVYREYSRVVFGGEGKKAADGLTDIYPTDGCSILIPGPGLKMSCKSVICSDTINKSFTSFLFKSTDLCGKMTVRSRREGDTIRLTGQNCTKTLKKLFIERRIPVRKRNFIPVIADEEGVLAVYGIGMGGRAVPESGDDAFLINFEEI